MSNATDTETSSLAQLLSDSPIPHLGSLTPALFSDVSAELSALTRAAGIFDLGYRARLRITGTDRVRWLNGMVTNSVKALGPGDHNYTFVLNAQGRIQGDAEVFALEDALILETDRSQLAHLQAHFDRFIIMDDVELTELPGATIGLAGATIALDVPMPKPGTFAEAAIGGVSVTLANLTLRADRPYYEIWVREDEALLLWDSLLASGFTPCGLEAVESLRVLEGIPLYGKDIHEKLLVQETGQARALNFSKGCYLGQEIVERVRSRATVHRSVRQFRLTGDAPAPGAALTADGAPAGELTSVASVVLPPQFTGLIALGTVRNELLERSGTLAYPSGTAVALDTPPRF
jgi:folate-binding protein YgfZ